jgi:hypothetical protein
MPMVANTNVITLYSIGKFISFHHFCYLMNILLQPNGKLTSREHNRAAVKGTFNSDIENEKNLTGFPVECAAFC